MNININNFSQAEKYSNFSASFNIHFPIIQKNYHEFLKGYKSQKLKKIVKIDKASSIKAGDLAVYKNSFQGLKIFVVKKEDVGKKGLVKLSLVGISKAYFLWALQQKEIKDYTNLFIRGNYIKSLSLKDLLEIKIPLEKKHSKFNSSILFSSSNPHKKAVSEYLLPEYQFCLKHSQRISAMVLAGSILEGILIEIGLSSGVKEGHFKHKTLGQIIKVIEIEKLLDKKELSSFKIVKNARNHIHINKLIGINSENLSKQFQNAEKAFNTIIKNFGI